jgi:hypothetical protein
VSLHQNPDSIRHTIDAISISVVLGTLAQWLPPLAALVSIIWGCIRIYETDTVQRALGRK